MRSCEGKYLAVLVVFCAAILMESSVGSTNPAAQISTGSNDSSQVFVKADQAQKSATSYRVRMDWVNKGKHMRIIEEVVCPYRKRIRFVQEGRKIVTVLYQIEGRQYSGTRRDGSIPIPSRVVGGCAGGPEDSIGGTFNLNATMQLFTRGVITGEPKILKRPSNSEKNLSSDDCWESEPEPWDQIQDDITLCLSRKDGLPSRITIDSPAGETKLTYSDWNSKAITVTLPN